MCLKFFQFEAGPAYELCAYKKKRVFDKKEKKKREGLMLIRGRLLNTENTVPLKF